MKLRARQRSALHTQTLECEKQIRINRDRLEYDEYKIRLAMPQFPSLNEIVGSIFGGQ